MKKIYPLLILVVFTLALVPMISATSNLNILRLNIEAQLGPSCTTSTSINLSSIVVQQEDIEKSGVIYNNFCNQVKITLIVGSQIVDGNYNYVRVD